MQDSLDLNSKNTDASGMRFIHHLGLTALTAACTLLTSCGPISGGSGGHIVGRERTGTPLGSHPSVEARAQQIAQEPTGNFYYGRRYFVNSTTFWGYLRKPRQPWQDAKLVVMNEWSKYKPDQLPENGPSGARKGFDQNYEYRIYGNYTGKNIYDPNSNQMLPEFRLTNYQLLDRDPGWLFGPTDRYNPNAITLPNQNNGW